MNKRWRKVNLEEAKCGAGGTRGGGAKLTQNEYSKRPLEGVNGAAGGLSQFQWPPLRKQVCKVETHFSRLNLPFLAHEKLEMGR